jgi:ribulose-5-phosphate 4-epimerase/fuculose-1-phosphate aldolase
MNTVPKIDTTTAQPANGIDPAEWEVRIDLAACYRLVDLYGMTDLHLNHISARVPGSEEHFLINPFGMMYEEITASSLIKVDLDGKIISNANPQYGVNLPGYVIHSAIHGARHDVACVLHTHTKRRHGGVDAEVRASAADPDRDALGQGRLSRLRGRRGRSRRAQAPGREPRRCRGDDPAQPRAAGRRHDHRPAFNNIYRLERACQTQLLALACNSEIQMPPAEVIAKSNAQLTVMPSPDAKGKRQAHGSLEWPALKRMLDRRDPSYKT